MSDDCVLWLAFSTTWRECQPIDVAFKQSTKGEAMRAYGMFQFSVLMVAAYRLEGLATLATNPEMTTRCVHCGTETDEQLVLCHACYADAITTTLSSNGFRSLVPKAAIDCLQEELFEARLKSRLASE